MQDSFQSEMAGFSTGEVYPNSPSEFKSLAEVQVMAQVASPPIVEEIMEEVEEEYEMSDPKEGGNAAVGQGMGFGLDVDDGAHAS